MSKLIMEYFKLNRIKENSYNMFIILEIQITRAILLTYFNFSSRITREIPFFRTSSITYNMALNMYILVRNVLLYISLKHRNSNLYICISCEIVFFFVT